VTTAIRNEALPQGKSRKTTNSAAAARETSAVGRQLGSLRTARAIVSGVSTPIAMINKNAIPWTQPVRVWGLPLTIGTTTLNVASTSATPKEGKHHDRKMLARLHGN
jgi:hypothetical protein